MRISDWSSDVCSSDLQPRRARHDDSGDAALLDLPALASLVDGHCGNPFALLGPQADPDGKHTIIRAYLPQAERVEVIARNDDTQLAELSTPQSPGLFVGRIARDAPYRLRIHWVGATQETEDPYSFGQIGRAQV